MEAVLQTLRSRGVCDESARITSSSTISTPAETLFVKMGTGGERATLRVLAAEAAGLDALRAAAPPSLRVPRPIFVGGEDHDAFIVMEHLELRPPLRQRRFEAAPRAG